MVIKPVTPAGIGDGLGVVLAPKPTLEEVLTHIYPLLHKCGFFVKLPEDVFIGRIFMSRISIDVTSEEHQKLKAMAALQGKSIKDYVIERTLGAAENTSEAAALKELEALLDERIRSAEKKNITTCSPSSGKSNVR